MAKKEEKVEKVENEELQVALNAIWKIYGADSVHRFNGTTIPGIEFYSTSSMSLDEALGGGIAKGRVIEIYGPESSGKTTLALHIAAEAQKVDPRHAAIVDLEHALDSAYAERLGFNFDKALISQPLSGDEALNIVELLMKSGQVSVIIIDSVAALNTDTELEKQIGEPSMGGQARLMSGALKRLSPVAAQTNTTLIFINQIRMKIGIVFGNPETTSGGNALKFYASQRIELRPAAKIKDGTGDDALVIARKINAKIVKNKVAPPFKETEFTICFGTGIDYYADLLNVAILKGVVKKSGAWYSYKNENIGQGESNTTKYLQEHQDAAQEIKDLILAT